MRDTYTSIQPKISSNNFCSIELNPITSLEKFSKNGQNLLALSTSDGVRSLTLSPSTNRLAKHGMRLSHKFSCNKRCEQKQWPNSDSIANLEVECHEFCCHSSSFFPCKALNLHPTCITTPILYNKTQPLKWWSTNCKLELTNFWFLFIGNGNDSKLNCMI